MSVVLVMCDCKDPTSALSPEDQAACTDCGGTGWIPSDDPAPLSITVAAGPTCPRCGGKEVLLGGPVRPFKVLVSEALGWESNCTDCKIWFTDDGRITEEEGKRK
jgi:hypothetical protein